MKAMDRGLKRSFRYGALVLALGAALHPSQVSGGTFWVTNNGDTGPGSLRQALLNASAGAGGTILFSNVTGVILLASQLPAVSANTELCGPGLDLLTLSGNNANRVLAFNAETTNTLSGLTIANGWTTGWAHGAGISNAGNLTIDRCAIMNNNTSNAFGAGIYTSGPLVVRNSNVATNITKGSSVPDSWPSPTSYAQPACGGGLYADGSSAVFRNCRFSGNQASGAAGSHQTYPLNGQFSVFPGSYVKGGGIYATGATVTADACLFERNSANTHTAAAGMGGAICAQTSHLLLRNCTLVRNAAQGEGKGGGIALQAGDTVLDNCTLQNGAYGADYCADAEGGGIYSSGGTVLMTNTSVSQNYAYGTDAASDWRGPTSFPGTARGAGLAFYGGSIMVVNCAIFRNSAYGGQGANGSSGYWPRPGWSDTPGGDAAGAGMSIASNAVVNLISTTISGNFGSGGIPGVYSSCSSFPPYNCYYQTNLPGFGYGSGFFADQSTVSVMSCTLAANLATNARTALGFSGGIHHSNSLVVLQNTLVTGNQGTNSPDIYGPITSQGFNLVGQTNPVTGLTSADIEGVDPRLGPLQDNGGPTWTHALLAGSPAIDAGISGGLLTDQRGQPRTVDDPAVLNAAGGDGTDIGAFEADPVLRFAQSRYDGSNVLIRFTTTSDKTYGLQYKTNLTNAAWLSLPGTFPGSGGIVTVTNSGVFGPSRQFYRAFER